MQFLRHINPSFKVMRPLIVPNKIKIATMEPELPHWASTASNLGGIHQQNCIYETKKAIHNNLCSDAIITTHLEQDWTYIKFSLG